MSKKQRWQVGCRPCDQLGLVAKVERNDSGPWLGGRERSAEARDAFSLIFFFIYRFPQKRIYFSKFPQQLRLIIRSPHTIVLFDHWGNVFICRPDGVRESLL